jgi:hypothetical protein
MIFFFVPIYFKERKGEFVVTEKIKRVICTAIAGASETMSINPSTNYKDNLPLNAKTMMRTAWVDMGIRMHKSIRKVGDEIGATKG